MRVTGKNGNGRTLDINDGVWRGALSDRPIWITRDEREMYLDAMETLHIQRCIANILIRGNWRLGYLPLLIEELERRG